MNQLTQTVARGALSVAMQYLEGNPEQNIPRIVDILTPFARREDMKRILATGKNLMSEDGNPYRGLILRAFREVTPHVRRKFISNFVFNAGMTGNDRAQALPIVHNCNIPFAILMDPTSACNLHCKGCWASEYNKNDSMEYELLDRIIREGKELGVYFYIYSGGEPTIRRRDLLDLAQVHNDCVFLAFTNGTLVDQEFAQALAKVGNFALAFSIEGFEDATDFRRGNGTYRQIVEGMRHMKAAGAPFGFSACYHAKNTEAVGDEAFLDFLIEQ
ncbi:MAG: radical SAM protein, partial [Rectinema sp.]|nr:radical SAM protein [Rectinema sp.]